MVLMYCKWQKSAKRKPSGKPRRARQTAKASGPYHLINRNVFKSEPTYSLKSDPLACN